MRKIFTAALSRMRLCCSGGPAGENVVTVSDIRGFVDFGGSIEFVTRSNRLSFIINLANAYKQEVHMNAFLLNLATRVIR